MARKKPQAAAAKEEAAPIKSLRQESARDAGEPARGEREPVVGDSASSAEPAHHPSLEQVLREYQKYLRGETTYPGMAEVLGVGSRNVQSLLVKAHELRAIVVSSPRDSVLQDDLNKRWIGPRYYVLNVEDDDLFFQGAAEVFFEELRDLLDYHPRTQPLHLGIVSGRTTGGMIEAICGLEWKQYVRRDSIPQKVNIYALNVSQTTGYSELRGNANVLTFLLARSFQKECPKSSVEAFGLSTELLQTISEAYKSDSRPQTRALIEHTDPARLRKSLESLGQGKETLTKLSQESELDMVITGVGSIKDSLFKTYCEQNGFDMEHLETQERIVGDIAYSPVTRIGEPRVLTKDEEQYVFYNAVSLDVLRQMSNAPRHKKVILVARNTPESNKVDPIYAAIGHRHHQYCNVLLSDHSTAKSILDAHK